MYGLGLVYYVLGDYSPAEKSLAKAAAMNDAGSLEARSVLEELFRAQDKSVDELDQAIAGAKEELGIH